MLFDLIHEKLVDAFNLLYSKLLLPKLCLYLVPLLLNRIGNLLAYVDASVVTSICR